MCGSVPKAPNHAMITQKDHVTDGDEERGVGATTTVTRVRHHFRMAHISRAGMSAGGACT